MSLTDAAGLAGVLIIIVAYALAALGRLDPERPLSLSANLAGACLILFSLLTEKFNLSATAMEGSWALVSLAGLLRWALRKASPRAEGRGRG
jgi:hypothetical protein